MRLALSKNHLGDDAIPGLIELLSKECLQEIDLRTNDLTAASTKKLKEAISENTTLQSVKLSGNKFCLPKEEAACFKSVIAEAISRNKATVPEKKLLRF